MKIENRKPEPSLEERKCRSWTLRKVKADDNRTIYCVYWVINDSFTRMTFTAKSDFFELWARRRRKCLHLAAWYSMFHLTPWVVVAGRTIMHDPHSWVWWSYECYALLRVVEPVTFFIYTILEVEVSSCTSEGRELIASTGRCCTFSMSFM